MLELALSDLEVLVVGNDISVNTKIRNWVVDVVSTVLLFVLVLGASGGVANWIRFQVDISGRLHSNFFTERGLSVLLIMEGNFDVVVHAEVWNRIVNWMWLRSWF